MRKGEYRGINVSAGPFLRNNQLKELRLFSLDKHKKLLKDGLEPDTT